MQWSIPSELIFSHLVVSGLCGFVIAWIYKRVYEGANYSPRFARSMVFLAMITSLVIIVIGNNLARAFGLVGAMSIIRFRTAVKDTMDIVFIFFSLAVGMASGVGLHGAAILSTFFIGGVIWLISQLRFGVPQGKNVLLQFEYTTADDKTAFIPILQQYCKSHTLVNVQLKDDEAVAEYSFHLRLRDARRIHRLFRDMKTLSGASRVRFYFDES